jgi:large subunit ribosomal protein L22
MTEKQYAPTTKEKKLTKVNNKLSAEAPIKKTEIKSEEQKTDVKNEEVKKEIKKIQPKIKKDYAEVNANNSKVSMKYAVEICKFIKGKRIGDAIRSLEEVSLKKKAVPMKGEYAHKKSVKKYASGAGTYPVNASKQFIILLKSLLGNTNSNNMDEPYLAEAIVNKAPKPRGRFGRWERKRCHIKLIAKEIKIKEKKTEEKK